MSDQVIGPVDDGVAIQVLVDAGIERETAEELIAMGDRAKELLAIAGGPMAEFLVRCEQLDPRQAQLLVFAFGSSLATLHRAFAVQINETRGR